MTITLYECTSSRSDRVRWALKELGIDFVSHKDKSLLGSREVKALNHTGKLPTIVEDGRSMFESAGICTYLADKHVDKGLIPKSGTWKRGKHEQWVSYVLTEVDAHLWSIARNTFIYPIEDRVTAIIEQNSREVEKSLQILDSLLGHHNYILGNEFMVTDIIVGYSTIWAQKKGLTRFTPKIEAFNQRLLLRSACPLSLSE